jgi:hypothetical protein
MNGDDMNPDGTTPGDDFWGSTPDWTDSTRRPRRGRSAARVDVTGAIKGLWNSAMSSGVEGTREHRVFDATAARPTDIETGIDPTMFDDLDSEIPVSASGRIDVFDVDAARDADADEPTLDPVPLDPTTEVPVVDASDPADGFEAMTPVSMLERDDTRKGAGRAIDPLLVRVGAVAVVTTLMVPLMIGLTSGDDDADTVASGSTIPAPTLVGAAAESPTSPSDDALLDPDLLPPAVPVNPPTSADAAEPATSTIDASSTSATADADGVVEEASNEATAPAAEATGPAGAESADSMVAATESAVEAPASDDAERVGNCAVDYEVQPGDYWLRLADGADAPLAEILEANGATTSTPLYPGTTICLPAGSSTPPPPPAPTSTSAPTTTAAPPTTAAPTTTSTTTTTTTTATTVAPSPAGPQDVQQIIRDVWPDELEERALEIAFRESRYVPTAKNSCCYGIFQIYWKVHRSWLADLGITDDQQLYDPATNARAALALYERSGGWGPWAQTAY